MYLCVKKFKTEQLRNALSEEYKLYPGEKSKISIF